jgi:hypothetical protein
MLLSDVNREGGAGIATAIFLLSLFGVVVLTRRIKRMPVGLEEES